MPIAQRGIAWRGRRACQCVIDATADFERLTKFSLLHRIYQACYSFASASAGTHSGGGALDTVQLTSAQVLKARQIGFWACRRYRRQGFSVDHTHWILFGCQHAARSLRYQESELRAGRNGLAGRGRDTDPRPSRIITYAQYKAQQKAVTPIQKLLKAKPLAKLTVRGVNAARKGGYVSRHVYYVQKYLRTAGFYKSVLDGKWGPVTQAALDNFRRSFGWPRADVVGPIGMTSLTLLKKAGKGGKPIAEK